MVLTFFVVAVVVLPPWTGKSLFVKRSIQQQLGRSDDLDDELNPQHDPLIIPQDSELLNDADFKYVADIDEVFATDKSTFSPSLLELVNAFNDGFQRGQPPPLAYERAIAEY